MKSYFTKFGAMLLCGVMLAVVGCHDYAEDIQQVNDKVDNLNSSVATEVKTLEDAIAALDAKVEETYATQAVVDALDKVVKQNANDLDALESALETAQSDLQTALNGKADKAVVETLSATVTSLQASLASLATKEDLNAAVARVEALESAIKTAQDDLKTAQDDLKTLRSDLTKLQETVAGSATSSELEAAKTALQAQITALETALATKVDLTAYNVKVAALEAEIESLKKADSDNKGLIDANTSALNELKGKVSALETAKAEILAALANKADAATVTALQGQVNDLVTKYTNEMKALTDRVVVLEGLITKVQKIVYVPTAANGKATVNALKTNVDGQYLSAPSTITYKVYPNYLAAELAEVKDIFSFDEVVVSKATTADDFKIVSVEGKANGELKVTFAASDANTTLLYTDAATESLSAALVLNHENEHFSTEYTNFVKGEETVLTMALKNVVADETEFELPYLNTKKTCPVHTGVEVKFVLNGTEYSKQELNDMGYGVNYSVVATKTNNPLFTVTDVNEGSYEKVVALAKKDGKNVATRSDINNASETVSYTFSSNVAKPKTISTTVKIVDFPYEMAATAPQGSKYAYEISYIAEAPHDEVDVVPGIVVSFGSEELTLEDLQEEGYDIALEQTAAYEIKEAANKKYFAISNENKYNNVVSLAKKDDGSNLAGPDQVGVKLGVNYAFTLTDQHNAVVRNNDKHKAVVEIIKAQAAFEFVNAEGAEAWWMYYPDASATTLKRKLQVNLKSNVVNGIDFSTLPFANIKTTAAGLDEVKFSWEDGKAYAEVTGFEWDKAYTVIGEVALDAADVTIKFDFETEGYNFPDLTYELLSTIESSFPYVANLKGNLAEFESIDALFYQIPEKNRGDITAAKWLAEVLSETDNTIESKFNDAKAPAGTSIVLSDDKTMATVSYDYNDFDVVPTTLAYEMTVETFYGQKLVITKGVNEANPFQFVFPTYNIRHSQVWVNATDPANPYSQVEPEWYYTDGKVSDFSTQKINMEEAFIVMDGDKELSVQELKNRNLDWVFSLELNGVEGYRNLPTITDNVITYDSELDHVGVDSKLYLVNDNGSSVTLVTNYADNYSNYVVKKCDPLQGIKFTPNRIEMVLDKVGGKYEVNLADYISLKDRENRLFIDGGKIYAANYIYDKNYFGITLDFNDKEVLAKLPYEYIPYVKVEEVTEKDVITDCVVKFNYTNEMAVMSDLEIVVTATYIYTWGQKSEDITVVFKAPKK